MRLPAPVAEEILRHLEDELPNEGCGLLAGGPDRVETAYCLTNVADSPTAFTIDPEGHFRALQHAEARGWELVGAFHSHVADPAYPSPTDVAGAAEPEWVWVVVGPMVGSPRMRAFRIVEGVVTEEELHIG